jgi:hypothetical protein
MRPETITAGIAELKAVYGDDALVAVEGSKTFIRIKDVELPPGCQPPQNDFLLELDTNQPKPKHYVRPGQTLGNGQPLKNPSNEGVAGESWMTFSYNFPYDDGDSLCRFVGMIRQRFSKHE